MDFPGHNPDPGPGMSGHPNLREPMSTFAAPPTISVDPGSANSMSGRGFEAAMEQADMNAPMEQPLSPPAPHDPAYTPDLVGDNLMEDLAHEKGIDLPPREMEENEYLGMDRAPNFDDNLRGVWRDDYSRGFSMLTEPHPMADAPEGAVDYVGPEGLDMSRSYPSQYVTDDFIARRNADPDWSPPESAFWQYDRAVKPGGASRGYDWDYDG